MEATIRPRIETFLNIEPVDLELERAGIAKDALKGEVAVVTGAASNVGLGFARAIAAAGANVVLSDINAKNGEEAQRVINEENEREAALFVPCDVTQEKDMKNMAQKAFESFGKVDILINNAMNMRLNGPVLKSSVEELDQSYAISARGVMLAIKEFVPQMIERGHGVVTYSATQFHYCPPMVGGTIYTAGKAAATSLVMSLCNELGPAEKSGVGVFCFVPAGVARIDLSKFPPPPPGAPKFDPKMLAMPGFSSMIPPETGGAAMVYCILSAKELHGSGVIINDVLHAMNYPFPVPETVRKTEGRRLSDMELTMAFCNMGPGFTNRED